MRRVIRPVLAGALALAAFVVLAPEAKAGSLSCDRVEADYFEIDGMLDDWSKIRSRRVGQAVSGSFDLRCAFDNKRIYLSVNVRDDIMLRTAKAKAASEDNVLFELKVGTGGKPVKLRAFPAGSRQGPRNLWGTSKPPRWLQVEDSLQKKGFSIELSMPLAKIPGYGRGTPAVSAKVSFVDGDVYGKKARAAAVFKGRLHLAGGGGLAGQFLKAARLRWKDIKLDKLVNIDDDPGAERVLWGGAVIGIITDSFTFFTLPVNAPADVKRVRLVDFDGSKRFYIVAEYRQFGNGGSRDLVGIWRYTGAKFDRVFAFEVGKQLGASSIKNTWKLVKRGVHRKGKRKRFRGGVDLLIEAGQAVGWDEDNYPMQPATDVTAILLPWDEQTSAVYWIQGGSIHGGDAKRGR